MSLKRKRTPKIRLDSASDEMESTFINNSDYMVDVRSPTRKSSEKDANNDSYSSDASNSSRNGGNSFRNDDDSDEDVFRAKGKRKGRVEDSILQGIDEEDEDQEDEGDEELDAEEENDKDEDDVFEDIESNSRASESETNTSTQSNNIHDKSTISLSFSKNTALPPPESESSAILDDNIEPIENESQQTTIAVPMSKNSGLSYSQQQSEIMLQSPTKRREITSQPKKNDDPRLVIDKLVLTNFKSYAGTQVIGPFNASFSAVVGPNGSGKSNVIDSMLFVFGFRASKMRQGKLSELIHNSSGSQQLTFCSVDIHFHHVLDDPDVDNKADVIPGSELVISRKAFRNNSSSYYVNGNLSNYTEVTSFLKNKGIDLDHKRFLILQGEVESIAQMKPKAERENDDGLLEYLEDIIGTSSYKKLIEDNLLKVDELNDICLEKENRFVLVEKDKDSLEEKKVEALKFLESEKELISKKSIQFQSNIIHCRHILDENNKKITAINEELDKEREANAEISKEIDIYIAKQKAIQSSIGELSEEITKNSKKQRDVHKKHVALEEKIKNLNGKVKKITKTKENSKKELASATQKLQSKTAATEQFHSEMDELTSNLEIEKAKLDEIRTSLTAKTAKFSNEIESLQTKLEPWNEKLKEKQNAIELTQSAIDILQNQKVSTAKQLEEARQRLTNIKSEGKEKESQYIDEEAKLEKIIEQIALGEEQVNIEKQKLDSQRSQVAALRQKTQDAANSLSNFQNKNKVLSSLMRLMKSGRIEGFYGRLGDLGVIDDMYDIAISTACPGLDSMVVETVETAQACIDYLRKNKLGYANFICLNKLRQFNLSPIQTPGNPANIKRLFDLIRPVNAKFAPAFYSKLYDTLVAPDLNEAKKAAYGAKRWKVVTLDGKVVDTSGTMSGGGSSFAKGAMRLSNSNSADAMDVSPEDVDQMKEDLHKLEQSLEHAEVEYQEKMNMLKKLRDLQPETDFTISRLRLDIQSLASEKKEISLVCKKLIAEDEENQNNHQIDFQIEEKQEELRSLSSAKDSLKAEMSDLESQIKVLEEKIMDAGGVDLKIQNSKVDSIKQKMEILNEKTAGDRMEVKKLENEIKRHTKLIEMSSKELESAESDLEAISSDHRTLSEQLEQFQNAISTLEASKNEKEGELENLRIEIDEQQEKINKFKSVQIELENKLEKYQAHVRRAERNVEENKESLAALVVRDAEPYINWLEEEEQKKYNGAILEELDESALDQLDIDAINQEIEKLEDYMNTVKVDIEVLKEYGSKKIEFESRRNDLNGAVQERDELKSYCEDLKRKRLDEFMEGFNIISMTLKDMYRMITIGGNAELELVDSLDPFSEGILFSVMPPKKSWKNISNLSGGEKTLSSLALVFALHQYKPTPLYVMDEIDAALDFRNVSIVANYIKERTKNAQFIVISLRNNMFELAQQLVGIYKINNMTRSISLQNKNFVTEK
ncbi:RecF/RecN/SMC [Scheffersomyces xylosifermentans]|uniref:RecF/RecN/SMC n=1 Tax=Scheffersomyces xylosifermentans TaxID=1304137 RepID=UPI00315D82CE